MKTCIEYINESSKRDDLEHSMKYVFSNDVIKTDLTLDELMDFASKALKSSRVKVKDIQNEISWFDDPDDLFRAIDRNELPDYAKFMDEMSHAISISKYGGGGDDIVDQLAAAPEFVFDLVEIVK